MHARESLKALRRLLCFATAAAALVLTINSAHARPRHHHHHHRHHYAQRHHYAHAYRHHHYRVARQDAGEQPSFSWSNDPRPGAWCGWWLRHYLGFADRTLNLAIAWARIGHAASGPAPGVVAVWPHHVGVVTSVPGPGRIVLKSGNDGHAVRERERSTRGVVAWRVVN